MDLQGGVKKQSQVVNYSCVDLKLRLTRSFVGLKRS